MIGRPCKPDPDLNWLWRTLLPNTPMPACGSSSESAATPVSIEDAAKSPAPAQKSRQRKDLSESPQSE
jgi:hypothetical protein